MSHELGTPLNSMLILSRQLAENIDENLTAQQVQFAATIHSSGADLLSLIHGILEAAMMAMDIGEVVFKDVIGQLERSFHQVAQDNKLDFVIEQGEDLGPYPHTDEKRLQQV